MLGLGGGSGGGGSGGSGGRNDTDTIKSLRDIFLGGRDRVDTNGSFRSTSFGGDKDHIHAESVEHHLDGSYTVTDHQGRSYELPAGSVETIGSDVEVKSDY